MSAGPEAYGCPLLPPCAAPCSQLCPGLGISGTLTVTPFRGCGTLFPLDEDEQDPAQQRSRGSSGAILLPVQQLGLLY